MVFIRAERRIRGTERTGPAWAAFLGQGWPSMAGGLPAAPAVWGGQLRVAFISTFADYAQANTRP